MEKQIKVPTGTKEPMFKKAGGVFENVKEKVEEKTEGLINKAKESELAEKAKEKMEDLKEGTKNLFNKVTDKFHGKK